MIGPLFKEKESPPVYTEIMQSGMHLPAAPLSAHRRENMRCPDGQSATTCSLLPAGLVRNIDRKQAKTGNEFRFEMSPKKNTFVLAQFFASYVLLP